MSPVGRESLVTPELPLVCLDSPLLLLDCSARGGGGNGPEKENEQRVSQLVLFKVYHGTFNCRMGAFFSQHKQNMEGPQTNKSMNWANLQSDTHLFMFHAVVISSSLSWETYAWVEGAWSRERYFAQIMDVWVTILLTIEREVFFQSLQSTTITHKISTFYSFGKSISPQALLFSNIPVLLSFLRLYENSVSWFLPHHI